MDKLQPLIKHRFWICFGFAVIFSMAGWWKANGKLSEDIDTRSKSVTDSFGNAVKGAEAPNPRWIEAAKNVNAADRKKYDAASSTLWERQKAIRMFDPELRLLRERFPGIRYMDPIPKVSTRGEWGVLYGQLFEKLLKTAHPFQPQDGTGLVVLDVSRVTHMNYDTWRLRPPTSDEIWKSQEDMWLLKSLLTSLARVNDGARRLTESGLREIVQLQLRGGTRDAPLPPIGATGGGGGGGGGGFGGGIGNRERDEDDAASGTALFSGPIGGAGQRTGPWSYFELPPTADFMSEEFGGFRGPLAAPGGGGRVVDVDSDDGGGPGFAGAFGPGAAIEADRYVDDDDALPYKTRAFFLDVKIRESDVPRMLAELTDSSFPVEIVRVDLNFGGAGAGAAGMYSGGGAGGRNQDVDDDEDRSRGMGKFLMGGGAGNGGAYGAGTQPAGIGGIPTGPVDNSPYARMKAEQSARVAQQTLAAAMSDPTLIRVRVGGLLTLYQSKEEAVAQNSNEAAAQQESGGAPAAVPTQPVDPAAVTPESPGLDGGSPPATESPATESPATETPATESPATETPATESPATESPATESPATESPATESPATESPATESPATPGQ